MCSTDMSLNHELLLFFQDRGMECQCAGSFTGPSENNGLNSPWKGTVLSTDWIRQFAAVTAATFPLIICMVDSGNANMSSKMPQNVHRTVQAICVMFAVKNHCAITNSNHATDNKVYSFYFVYDIGNQASIDAHILLILCNESKLLVEKKRKKTTDTFCNFIGAKETNKTL